MATATALIPSPPAKELDSEGLYEIVNGERKEIPHMGALAGLFASVLSHYLGTFALERKLGLVAVEVLFRLKPDGSTRRPDIAFVNFDRIAAPAELFNDPAVWEVVPNLAVEVVSPTITADEIQDKLQDYFASGVQLVWVAYPRHRRIYVYESATRNRILSENEELDGGTALPGFRLSIAALFAALTKPSC
jgi:Uma2 family endonuclease